jgi:transposase-like protein
MIVFGISEEGYREILGFEPQTCWRGDTLEGLVEEIRRREKVIRIFPSEDSAWHLPGVLLAEEHPY